MSWNELEKCNGNCLKNTERFRIKMVWCTLFSGDSRYGANLSVLKPRAIDSYNSIVLPSHQIREPLTNVYISKTFIPNSLPTNATIISAINIHCYMCPKMVIIAKHVEPFVGCSDIWIETQYMLIWGHFNIIKFGISTLRTELYGRRWCLILEVWIKRYMWLCFLIAFGFWWNADRFQKARRIYTVNEKDRCTGLSDRMCYAKKSYYRQAVLSGIRRSFVISLGCHRWSRWVDASADDSSRWTERCLLLLVLSARAHCDKNSLQLWSMRRKQHTQAIVMGSLQLTHFSSSNLQNLPEFRTLRDTLSWPRDPSAEQTGSADPSYTGSPGSFRSRRASAGANMLFQPFDACSFDWTYIWESGRQSETPAKNWVKKAQTMR